MAERLAVWLNDSEVGYLERDAKGFKFQSTSNARALTVSAEGGSVPWPRPFARNWFDGLLPDDAQRTSAEDNHGVQRGDTFGLLAAIGWECAGAVSVLPEGRRPASGSYRPLTVSEVWERLDALPLLVHDVDQKIRMSLGGAQEKMLLRWSASGSWELPLDGAVSTHILKPEPRPYRGLAMAEAFCLEAAASATPTARASLLVAAGHRPTLVVERFDRIVDGARITRVHQEDGCQLLGLPPTLKYAKRISPGLPQHVGIARALVARAADPSLELRRLLEQVTVNIALGNHDAHAKNYSIQHVAGVARLSPLYDVVPTRPFIPTDRTAALFVGGMLQFDEITRGRLLAEARLWGIPEAVGRSGISETLERLGAGIETAKGKYPSVRPEVRKAVSNHFARLNASSW